MSVYRRMTVDRAAVIAGYTVKVNDGAARIARGAAPPALSTTPTPENVALSQLWERDGTLQNEGHDFTCDDTDDSKYCSPHRYKGDVSGARMFGWRVALRS
jgi:hypothetical protein